jgi:DNA invertase Pin-like site-specific DNA recombinase
MAGKGLALIFGDKKGMPSPEEDDSEESSGGELRGVAQKMLDACKNDDVDLMEEALDDLKALDETWDKEGA